MSKDPLVYLKHIRDECQHINSLLNQGVDKDEFLSDETLKRAITRSLEIIGEASKNIPPSFKTKWDAVNWKDMAGMRDRLIHGYMGLITLSSGMLSIITSLNYSIMLKK